jgi:hypothetical protein
VAYKPYSERMGLSDIHNSVVESLRRLGTHHERSRQASLPIALGKVGTREAVAVIRQPLSSQEHHGSGKPASPGEA